MGGAQGPQGPTGPSNKLAIGTVTTGTTAIASITGTAPNQTLNLTLPQGPKGDTGAQGPAGTSELCSDLSSLLPGSWFVTNYPQSGTMSTSNITFKSDGTYNIENGRIPLSGSSNTSSTGKWQIHQGYVLQMRDDSSLTQVYPVPLSCSGTKIILERFGNKAILTKVQTVEPFNISGKIVNSNGSAVQGVALSLNNNLGYAVSDSLGLYRISGLGLLSGTYTITPSLQGSTFTPSTATIAVNGTDVSNINFTSAVIPVRDLSNVTDFTKLKSTIINANNLLNSYILNNTSLSDTLYNSNAIEIAVPVQNYFDNNPYFGAATAKIFAYTIKYNFPVQASASRTPYGLVYTEYSSTGTSLSSLRLNSLPPNYCSNANDVNNPTSECVQYNYTIKYITGESGGASASVNLVKSYSGDLTILELPK